MIGNCQHCNAELEISDTIITSTPTSTPIGPTNTPGGPTNTPSSPTSTPDGPTNTPGGPTNTPGGPTNTPGGPTNSGGGSSGGNSLPPTALQTYQKKLIIGIGFVAIGILIRFSAKGKNIGINK